MCIFCKTFYLILENMSTIGENFVFFVNFYTCDIVYNLYMSLLPPIVLNNLFAPGELYTWVHISSWLVSKSCFTPGVGYILV